MIESSASAPLGRPFQVEAGSQLPDGLTAAPAGVRDATHRGLTEVGGQKGDDPDAVARRQRVRSALRGVPCDMAGELLSAGSTTSCGSIAAATAASPSCTWRR